MFNEFVHLINEYAKYGFNSAFERLNLFISDTNNFLDIISQIGTIPESIAHDSTEEKLFAKSFDAILSRAFRELGLNSTIVSKRADSADVIAKSNIHGYTLVADAKSFRMSRTAKNQKDFKVTALSGWRKDSDYAVLCAPYFHYPIKQSQIFAQSIDNNVCLLSWEHLIFLLKNNITENGKINLSRIWNFSETHSHIITAAQRKICFIPIFDRCFSFLIGYTYDEFEKALTSYSQNITSRSEKEKTYWENERKIILSYSRDQAIDELIKNKKIDEKIRQINSYVSRRICRD
ncbi:MAG: HindIII family type II restriction endonuclease [Defluviitaleaceae bacterium]|nr:HindIII family type II restriction endonuclease [Defluviitaleaceae bacterium]